MIFKFVYYCLCSHTFIIIILIYPTVKIWHIANTKNVFINWIDTGRQGERKSNDTKDSFKQYIDSILLLPPSNKAQNDDDYEDTATKTVTNKFENYLVSVKIERQKMIHPNSHPTYNERQQKIIEMIDWTLDKYKAGANIKMTNQQNEEQVIIDSIIKELEKKREVAITKKQKTLLKDEVLEYGEEEDTIDYILYIIGQLRSKSF